MTEVEAGEHSAGRNGYEPEQVEIEEVDDGWMATIEDTIDAPFGRAIGEGELKPKASAVAHCSLRGALPALFAGGTNCPNSDDDDAAIMWDSDEVHVLGDVHSNGFIWVDGVDNTIEDGELTYVTGYEINEPNDFPAPQQVPERDWPLEYPERHFNSDDLDNFAFEGRDDFTFYEMTQGSTTPRTTASMWWKVISR